MALTADQISQNLVQQYRLLNNSASGEIGTPERAIFDTVAAALAGTQIDITGLSSALDIDSKFGTNLDTYIGMFGFSRVLGTTATGFVVFTTPGSGNAVDLTIPAGTVIISNQVDSQGIAQQYSTTASVIIPANTTTSVPVPVQATTAGSLGNAVAGVLTILSTSSGNNIVGVSSVTNPNPITGGADQEDDNSLKVRFKNTLFRNLAGTQDQYLALGVSTAFSTKANVIGPISQYQEYIQVPQYDDYNTGAPASFTFTGTTATNSNVIQNCSPPVSGVTQGMYVSGSANLPIAIFVESVGTTTVTLSQVANGAGNITITAFPFPPGNGQVVAFTGTAASGSTQITGVSAANIASLATGMVITGTNVPTVPATFITGLGTTTVGLNQGTTGASSGTFIAEIPSYTTALSTNPYAQSIYTANPVYITTGPVAAGAYFYRPGVDFFFNWPFINQGDTYRYNIVGGNIEPYASSANQPNVTFATVYTGATTGTTSITPGQVLLLEYSYMSSESRNSVAHNIYNAVDVFVDGTNPTLATSTVIPPSAGSNLVTDNPNSVFYLENYRRDGQPTKRPVAGNIITPLYYSPLLGVPNTITIGNNTYYIGINYWLVHEVDNLGGSIRARDGIEWSKDVRSQSLNDVVNSNLPPETFNGPTLSGNSSPYPYLSTGIYLDDPTLAGIAYTVPSYTYDQNIVDLQATLEGAAQITTSVLAHEAKTRYFKLDISVVYSNGATPSNVNSAIQSALQTFFSTQYFGTVIRMSDLLQVIHNVTGVDNVRWSNDLPSTVSPQTLSPPVQARVLETDVNGLALANVTIDRVQTGRVVSGSIPALREIQNLYVVGQPTNGVFTLTYQLGPALFGTSQAMTLGNGGSQGAGGTFTLTTTQVTNAISGTLTANSFGSLATTLINTNVTNVTDPISTFQLAYTTVTYPAAGFPVPVVNFTTPITNSEYLNNFDFFLRDNELPALATNALSTDTLAGLIIRARAENTWIGPLF